MARAIWKGYISFGLVNIPVELYPSEQSEKLKFHLLDSKNQARIKYKRINEITGKEVPWEQITKAYEYEKDNYVLIDDKDFEEAASDKIDAIEISEFIPAKQLDFLYLKKPYYAVPGKFGDKGYVLLREILKNTNKVAIAYLMLRARMYIAAVIAYGDALVINILRYPAELKNIHEFAFPAKDLKQYKITTKELAIAEQLVDTMSAKWDPKNYKDEYNETLNKIIEKKLSGNKVTKKHPDAKKTAGTGKVIDFMELLKQSLNSKTPKKAKIAPAKKVSQIKKKKPKTLKKKRTQSR